MARTVAFFSYTRADDVASEGLLTEIRRRLEERITFHYGKPVEVFQDLDAIKGGEDWRERLEQALEEAVFLVPVVTPGFFNSEACRIELERFIAKGRELGRGDLILPLLWAETQSLAVASSESRDLLVDYIGRKQWTDWTEHRAKSVHDVDYELRRDIDAFAELVAGKLSAEERRAASAAERREEAARQAAEAERRRAAEEERIAEQRAAREAVLATVSAAEDAARAAGARLRAAYSEARVAGVILDEQEAPQILSKGERKSRPSFSSVTLRLFQISVWGCFIWGAIQVWALFWMDGLAPVFVIYYPIAVIVFATICFLAFAHRQIDATTKILTLVGTASLMFVGEVYLVYIDRGPLQFVEVDNWVFWLPAAAAAGLCVRGIAHLVALRRRRAAAR